MGRHAAEMSDLDRIAAQFEAVDSGALHLFTDGDTRHDNTDGAYRFIPAPIRHRRGPDGKRYKPDSDPTYVAQMEDDAKAWSADIEGTDEEKLALIAENVDSHKSKVLPATSERLPRNGFWPGMGLGALLMAIFAAGGWSLWTLTEAVFS